MKAALWPTVRAAAAPVLMAGIAADAPTAPDDSPASRREAGGGHLDELGGVGPGAVSAHPCDALLDAGGRDGEGLVKGAFERGGAPRAGGVHSGLLT